MATAILSDNNIEHCGIHFQYNKLYEWKLLHVLSFKKVRCDCLNYHYTYVYSSVTNLWFWHNWWKQLVYSRNFNPSPILFNIHSSTHIYLQIKDMKASTKTFIGLFHMLIYLATFILQSSSFCHAKEIHSDNYSDNSNDTIRNMLTFKMSGFPHSRHLKLIDNTAHNHHIIQNQQSIAIFAT